MTNCHGTLCEDGRSYLAEDLAHRGPGDVHSPHGVAEVNQIYLRVPVDKVRLLWPCGQNSFGQELNRQKVN